MHHLRCLFLVFSWHSGVSVTRSRTQLLLKWAWVGWEPFPSEAGWCLFIVFHTLPSSPDLPPSETPCQSSANNQFLICPLNEKQHQKTTFHFLSKWAERFSKRSAGFVWPQLKSYALLSWGRYYKSQTKFERSFLKYFSRSETVIFHLKSIWGETIQ